MKAVGEQRASARSESGANVVALHVDGLSFSYRKRRAVENLSWTIPGPCTVGILGPNGAGKTTLMRLLATVLPLRQGRIISVGFDLQALADRRLYQREIGYLPQDFDPWPRFSVAECVAYMGWLRGTTLRDAEERGTHVLPRLGLEHLKNRRLGTLSGGEKRRVGIAQALINHPKMLLLDEPTAGLDPEQRLQFRELMRNLGSETIVIVATHLVEDVATACDYVAVMRRGGFVFWGTPEELKARGAGGRGRKDAASDLEIGYLSVLDRAKEGQ